jgi:NAD-dependent SIR2 family protein deacetylase
MDAALEHAAELLREAERVVVFTGAGVSAESGIETFRDADGEGGEGGLWSKYDPMELAHIDAFARDPELVTRWYHWRFCGCVGCAPNPGHHAIAELEQRMAGLGRSFTLATQNIDGLHQRAGSRAPLELHGTILRWRSLATGEEYPIEEISFASFPPRCSAGGLLRPNVVWFGEALPEGALGRAMEAAAGCDLLLTVGTSAVVYPAAGLIEIARRRGAGIVEVNRARTAVSDLADVVVRAASGAALPAIVRAAFGAEER